MDKNHALALDYLNIGICNLQLRDRVPKNFPCFPIATWDEEIQLDLSCDLDKKPQKSELQKKNTRLYIIYTSSE